MPVPNYCTSTSNSSLPKNSVPSASRSKAAGSVHPVDQLVSFFPCQVALKKDGDPDAKEEKPASVRRFRLST